MEPERQDADLLLLRNVQQSLASGVELFRWWQEVEAGRAQCTRIPLVSAPERHLRNFGFLEQVALPQVLVPVLGVYQEMLFDSLKLPPGERHDLDWLCSQVREFALRYFMRISAAVQPPQMSGPSPRAPVPQVLRPFSWCPARMGEQGMGYSQLFSRRRGSGEIGAFPPEQRRAIVDVRQVAWGNEVLEPAYDWVVLYIRIFDFDLNLALLGQEGPSLQLPLREDAYVILCPELVIDRDHPEPGVLGEYGFGYTILSNPSATGRFAYGPNKLQMGFDQFRFRVLDNGEVRLREVFVVNQPTRLLNLDPIGEWGFQVADTLSLGAASRLLKPLQKTFDDIVAGFDPIYTGIDFANVLTGGAAARAFCFSVGRLLTLIMTQHVMVEYRFFLETMQVWDSVGDWTAEGSLPGWITNP